VARNAFRSAPVTGGLSGGLFVSTLRSVAMHEVN
jgi:hypothetical protein